MCFSAGASFGAGVVLSVIGIAAIKKTKTPSQIPFASIPFIFAVQQISEGFVWLSLSNPAYAFLQQAAAYNFLFFAQVVWPFWIPFAILKLEPNKNRIRAGMILVGIGALVSLYFAYCLFTFPVEANILGYHIAYMQNHPVEIGFYLGAFYIIATIVPTFISSIRRMWVLGITILISYIMTRIFYSDYVVSVWCFFASVISLVVFAIMQNKSKNSSQSPAEKVKI